MNKFLFHVTNTTKVPLITAKGIMPMQTSNWIQAGNRERYGNGEIYAFEKLEDAVRLAAKMDWEFNKSLGTGKISILMFKVTEDQNWEVDSNDPVSQLGSKGKWFKYLGRVSPENILSVQAVLPDTIRKLAKCA